MTIGLWLVLTSASRPETQKNWCSHPLPLLLHGLLLLEHLAQTLLQLLQVTIVGDLQLRLVLTRILHELESTPGVVRLDARSVLVHIFSCWTSGADDDTALPYSQYAVSDAKAAVSRHAPPIGRGVSALWGESRWERSRDLRRESRKRLSNLFIYVRSRH